MTSTNIKVDGVSFNIEVSEFDDVTLCIKGIEESVDLSPATAKLLAHSLSFIANQAELIRARKAVNDE